MSKIGLSKLIPVGSLISIRIENELTWSLNIVYNCQDDSIDVPLTSCITKACVFVGTLITIKFENEYFEYIISGSISKIELTNPPFIRVQVLDIFSKKNNRIFARQDVYLPANLSIDNNIYYCTITNISLGGIAFVLDKKIQNVTECEANIFLNEKSSIFCKGILLRSFPQEVFQEYNMKFTFMDEENSNSLYSYLYSIDNSYDELRDKYL